jgi:hypothetical protein
VKLITAIEAMQSRREVLLHLVKDDQLDHEAVGLFALGLGLNADELLSDSNIYAQALTAGLDIENAPDWLPALLQATFVDGVVSGCVFTRRLREEDHVREV